MLDYGRTFMGDVLFTPSALAPWIDVSYYDSDILRDQTVINIAALAAGSTNVILSISDIYSINDSITLPTNITFMCVNKGALTIANGKIFTVQGMSLTGGRIIHSGAGIMKYGKVSLWHTATPEAAIYAKCGSTCHMSTATSGKLYVKQTGDNTATGWVMK
jgi:hypothetical protein